MGYLLPLSAPPHSSICKYVQRLFDIIFQLSDEHREEQKSTTNDLSITQHLIHLTRAAQGWDGAGFLPGWDAQLSQTPHGSQSALSYLYQLTLQFNAKKNI